MSSGGKRDYYETLGVARGTSVDDLKKAYRHLAVQYHPDKNPGNKAAEEKFKELSEAYEVLSDPQKRKMYDQFGHAANAGAAGGPGAAGFDPNAFGSNFNDVFGDIFGDLFGGGGPGGARGGQGRGRGRRSGGRGGADIKTAIDISFEESAFGGEKIITIPRSIRCATCEGSGAKAGTTPATCGQCGGRGEVSFQQGFFAITRPCDRCSGTGQTIPHPCNICSGAGVTRQRTQIAVKIPAGVDTGQRLKLTGEGEPGERGGHPGDLYVVINIQPHDFFSRQEFDVICEVPITFTQAALGADIDVPTLEGKVKMKVRPATQSHQILRLKGKGLARLGSYGRGDQLVRVIVETPKDLSTEQRELLKRFEEISSSEKSHPMHNRFFEKVKNFFG
ncbi:MAG: molecular chaperone DnaJ [Bdellovibrionota bacterium]